MFVGVVVVRICVVISCRFLGSGRGVLGFFLRYDRRVFRVVKDTFSCGLGFYCVFGYLRVNLCFRFDVGDFSLLGFSVKLEFFISVLIWYGACFVVLVGVCFGRAFIVRRVVVVICLCLW